MGDLGEWHYPDLMLGDAIDLTRKIGDLGGNISLKGLARIENIDPRGAGLHSRVKDLTDYGLLQESEEGGLKLTSLGEDIAQGNVERAKDAFLNIPLYVKIYERLRGREPTDNVAFQHILFEISRADDSSINRRLVKLKNNYLDALPFLTGAGTAMSPRDTPLNTSRIGVTPTSESFQGPMFSVTSSDFYLADRRGTPFFIGLDTANKIDLAIRYLEDAKESLLESSKHKPEKKGPEQEGWTAKASE